MKEEPDYSKLKLRNGKLSTKAKDFHDSKSILEKVFKDLSLDEKIQDFEIMKSWKSFSAERSSKSIANNTFAHRITKDRKLIIGVKSAIIANELQFQKAKLEKNFIVYIKDLSRKISGISFELRS